MSEILAVSGVSKKFCRNLRRSLWYGVEDLTNEVFARRVPRTELRRDEFWALRDLSFSLGQGETLGLIGANGAGKSTLLKMINGLIPPDTGSITVHGRVGALIELGTGFNPILSGRENIYVNAAVLGLKRAEVDRRLEEIIDFAEIHDAIDAPVQTYSSGMKVRLGFSVAANLNPELLLIDEILSVGDSSFRQRCLDRIADYKRDGGTIILVSHNAVVVESVSDRVLLLEGGRMQRLGDPAEVVLEYEHKALELSRNAEVRLRAGRIRPDVLPDEHFRISSVEIGSAARAAVTELDFAEPIRISLKYETDEKLDEAYFILTLRKGSAYEPVICTMHMAWDNVRLRPFPRAGTLECVIEEPALSPGVYHLSVAVQAAMSGAFGQKWHSPPRDVGTFTILPHRLKAILPGAPAMHLVSGMPPVIVPHSWTMNGQPLTSEGASVSRDGDHARTVVGS